MIFWVDFTWAFILLSFLSFYGKNPNILCNIIPQYQINGVNAVAFKEKRLLILIFISLNKSFIVRRQIGSWHISSSSMSVLHIPPVSSSRSGNNSHNLTSWYFYLELSHWEVNATKNLWRRWESFVKDIFIIEGKAGLILEPWCCSYSWVNYRPIYIG